MMLNFKNISEQSASRLSLVFNWSIMQTKVAYAVSELIGGVPVLEFDKT